jgi:hypothetical protein
LKGEEKEIVYIENLRLILQVIYKLIDPKRVLDIQFEKNNKE